jgi:tRNA U34 5-methylaminomethyl-2-thiouridine-forming methyltransferase MnmC
LIKQKEFLESRTSISAIDLIYFDAFAPSAQPELWTEEIFKNLLDDMSDKGILVTYCAKGSVKRAMKSAGWKIEAIPGPPGKREMTRAFAHHE